MNWRGLYIPSKLEIEQSAKEIDDLIFSARNLVKHWFAIKYVLKQTPGTAEVITLRNKQDAQLHARWMVRNVRLFKQMHAELCLGHQKYWNARVEKEKAEWELKHAPWPEHTTKLGGPQLDLPL